MNDEPTRLLLLTVRDEVTIAVAEAAMEGETFLGQSRQLSAQIAGLKAEITARMWFMPRWWRRTALVMIFTKLRGRQ